MYRNALPSALVVLLSASLIAPSSRADSIRYVAINWTLPAVPPVCEPLPLGVNQVQIYLDLTTSAKSVRFSGPSGGSLSAIAWEYPVVGDNETVQTLDLAGCQNGSILLGTATYTAEVPGYCHGLIKGPQVARFEQSPPIVVGCDDVERFADGACTAARPTLLSPADGAVDVSLTPVMTWEGSAGEICTNGIGIQAFTLYLGTSPETLASVNNFPDSNQWQPQTPLLPGTTYYWRMSVVDFYWEYAGSLFRFSPIHSFTTQAAVAVEEIPWSTLKRAYRE